MSLASRLVLEGMLVTGNKRSSVLVSGVFGVVRKGDCRMKAGVAWYNCRTIAPELTGP